MKLLRVQEGRQSCFGGAEMRRHESPNFLSFRILGRNDQKFHNKHREQP